MMLYELILIDLMIKYITNSFLKMVNLFLIDKYSEIVMKKVLDFHVKVPIHDYISNNLYSLEIMHSSAVIGEKDNNIISFG